MLADLERIEKNALASLEAAKDEASLAEWHVAHLLQ